MSYADITRNDSNPMKRFLQRRRISDALSLADNNLCPENIVDFGAGDGELCKGLAKRFPNARIFCYEPCPSLRSEAENNLKDMGSVAVVSSLDQVPIGVCNLLFCLEVFEHLPQEETLEALQQIKKLLAIDGVAIIGVPIEVFTPALLKGLFRMTRRYGEFDAQLINILRALVGFPPRDRPVGEIAPGYAYHFHHMGFDYRLFRELVARDFKLLRTVASPVKWWSTWLNSEVYFVVQKATFIRC